VFEAGCHIGDTLMKMIDATPRGQDITFLAIDPNRSKLDWVREFIRLNPSMTNGVNIEFVQGGISNKKSVASEVQQRHPGAWQLKEEVSPSQSTVTLYTASELIQDRALGLVHLDVEGFEYKALSGMQYHLVQHGPPVMVEIVHGNDRDKICPFLESIGYEYVWGGDHNQFFMPKMTFHLVVVCTENYTIGKYGVNMIQQYCEKHEYELTIVEKGIDGLHVNFSKNEAAIQVLKTTTHPFVLTIDADVCFPGGMRKSLRSILPPILNAENVMFAPHDYHTNRTNSKYINSGFIFWKTCRRSIEINEIWLKLARGECSKYVTPPPVNRTCSINVYLPASIKTNWFMWITVW